MCKANTPFYDKKEVAFLNHMYISTILCAKSSIKLEHVRESMDWERKSQGTSVQSNQEQENRNETKRMRVLEMFLTFQ